MRDDVFVRYIPLPAGVHSVCAPCADGYNVYINDNLSSEQAQIAYLHELVHINMGHCENDIDVDKIERETHDQL